MTWMTLTGIGGGENVGGATTSAAVNPQLQFFENLPGHLVAATNNPSTNTLSIHAVNIPLSLSFNNVIFLVSQGFSADFSQTWHFGLYSLTGSTLSLANSASRQYTSTSHALTQEWVSMVTSATQNITPGTWYFAFNYVSVNNANVSDRIAFNSSINPGNAIPGGFLRGRMTASTNAMPGSIATSALDITGSDAERQPFIIITA